MACEQKTNSQRPRCKMVDSITEHQAALISHADGETVIITVHELRLIARGLHDVTPEQAQALANFALDWVDGRPQD